MAAGAVATDITVVEARGRPGLSGMAIIAFEGCSKVIDGFTRGSVAVMTARAWRVDIAVVEECGLPAAYVMAVVTFKSRDNVVARFACLLHTVMAAAAVT